MGVKIPLGTEDRLQVQEQLPLQPLLPLPAQFYPPQRPVFPPGDGHRGPGCQALPLQAPGRVPGIEGPAIAPLLLVQRGGGQPRHPAGTAEKGGYPRRSIVFSRPGQGNGQLPRLALGQAVVAGQQAEAAVGQQLAPGFLPSKAFPLPGQGGSGGRTELFGEIPLLLLHDGRAHRHPLLEQLPVGGHVAVLHEPLLHHVVPQGVVDGHQAHPQVVGHIGADHLVVLPAGQAGGGVVHRLVQAVAALQPHVPQAAQVAQGAAGGQQQRQKGGVGGDHQLCVQPPLQPQGLDAVGLVLVAQAGVEGAEARFGDAPGGFGLVPPALLGVDTEGQRLIQEGIGLAGHEEVGHEILEHGARPGGHAAVVVVPQQHPAQPPPVAGGDLSPGHRDKAGLPGLAGHQVVKAVGEPVLLHLIADGEQPPLPVEEGGAVHGAGQLLRPAGQHVLPPLVQPLPQGDETAPQIAAVYRRHIPGVEGGSGGCVVPVVQMALPLVQSLHRVQDVSDQLRRPLPGQQVQVRRRHHRQQGHTDVGGGGPPGQGGAGLLLPVVRGEVTVLGAEEFVKITPDQGGLVEEEGPVGGRQGLSPAGGTAHRPGQHRGQQPDQAHRSPKAELGKEDYENPRRRRKPGRLIIKPDAPLPLLRLGGGDPGQQVFVGHGHPPQGGGDGRQADIGLIGQEDQLNGGLQNGPGQTGDDGGVVPPPFAAAADRQLRPGQQQIGGRRHHRHAPRPGKDRPGDAHAQHQGQQGKDGGQRPAQVVKNLPPGQRGQGVVLLPAPAVRDPPSQPGQQLPVPPDPPVEPGKVAVDLPGTAVGQLHLPQQARPEVAALQQIVGQDSVVGKAAVQTGVEGIHRKDAFSGVGALVKEVMIHVAGGGAVGVHASQPAEHPGKEGLVGRLQLHCHPGLEQGVTGGDNAPLEVDDRLVQGVEHGPNQLPGGAHIQAGVRIQSDDIPHLAQPALLPRLHLQAGVPPLQQADQLGERPPFPLPAHITLVPGAEGRGAEKQVKPSAVLPVQVLHRPAGVFHPGGPLLPHGDAAVRQVGQNAQPQLGTGVPVGQAVPLQQGGQPGTAVLPGEEGHHHAQGPPLPGDSPLQLHPGDGAGRNQADQEKVQHIFHNVGQGQEQQQGGQRSSRRPPQGQGGQQGQSRHRQPVTHPGAGPLRTAQGFPVQVPAHMAAGTLFLLGQLQGPLGGLPLPQAPLSCQLAHPLPVPAAGVLIHTGVVARGVPLQHLLHPAGPLQQGAPLRPGQDPQGSEDRPHLPGGHPVLLEGVQVGAQPGQPLHQRTGQGWNQEGQLPLGQRTHRLKALQIEGQPPLVQVGHCPQGTPGAALEERTPLRRSAQGFPPLLQGLPGPLSLPDGQIVVVQQPLRRSGQGGPAIVPEVQGLSSPAHRVQAGPQRLPQGAAGDGPAQPDLPGGVGGVLL